MAFDYLLSENRNEAGKSIHWVWSTRAAPKPVAVTLRMALAYLPSILRRLLEGSALLSPACFCSLKTSSSFSRTNCPGREKVKKAFWVMCGGICHRGRGGGARLTWSFFPPAVSLVWVYVSIPVNLETHRHLDMFDILRVCLSMCDFINKSVRR